MAAPAAQRQRALGESQEELVFFHRDVDDLIIKGLELEDKRNLRLAAKRCKAAVDRAVKRALFLGNWIHSSPRPSKKALVHANWDLEDLHLNGVYDTEDSWVLALNFNKWQGLKSLKLAHRPATMLAALAFTNLPQLTCLHLIDCEFDRSIGKFLASSTFIPILKDLKIHMDWPHGDFPYSDAVVERLFKSFVPLCTALTSLSLPGAEAAVACLNESSLEYLKELYITDPVDIVIDRELEDYSTNRLTAAGMLSLSKLRAPALELFCISSESIQDNYQSMDGEHLKNLAMAAPNWPALKSLDIEADKFATEGLAVLVSSPLADTLTSLELVRVQESWTVQSVVDQVHFIRQISKGTWKRLRRLKFGDWYTAGQHESIAPLARTTFPCLTSLEVGCVIEDSLESLVYAEWLPKLKVLKIVALAYNPSSAYWPGFLNLFSHGKFENMEELDLGRIHYGFTAEQALEIAFVAHGKMPNIKTFRLPFGNGGAVQAALRGRPLPEDFEGKFGIL